MTDTAQLPIVQPPAPLPPPFWRRARFWLLLALALLVGWQWWETQRRLASAHKALRQGYAESEKRMHDAEQRLARAVEATEALEQKYRALEARQEEFQGEATALRQIYQDAAQTREDALIADMEQNLNFAAQQLQLAGNARAAIVALSGLDERLARNDNPLFLPVRRALAKELEQLRATPFVDISGMSLRLENIITGIHELPLVSDFSITRHQAPPARKTATAESWWRQGLRETWQEVKGMVRIERFDRKEPVLLSPDQALILRENLKLRLLNARLALFAHDQATFRGELKAAAQLLERYFNTREKPVIAMREAIATLAATELNVEFPNLNESLIAIQTLKNNRERR
ncbi:MAG: uroporphyrinogen-III C-methyltransferase [Zoogloeaceae bacterium]|jgi:uroporphyrin-3 C-methyltransferase|nr:uroporphyrinogen-III C-methyltransferase [Zoogloeaceae bacterium]